MEIYTVEIDAINKEGKPYTRYVTLDAESEEEALQKVAALKKDGDTNIRIAI
jgi:hypothetical protein